MSNEPTQSQPEPSPDPTPMDVGAYVHAVALDRIAVLEEQLRQMAIERSELTTMAERTGVAESEASQLRQAARIDARIALFARAMDEQAKIPPNSIEREPGQILSLMAGRLADLEHANRMGYRSEVVMPVSASIAVYAMKLADLAIDRERQRMMEQRRRREAELKAQAPPT